MTVLLFLFFLIITSGTNFAVASKADAEIKLITKFEKIFNVRFCLFISEEAFTVIDDVKRLSQNYILSSAVSFSRFLQISKEKRKSKRESLIVTKELLSVVRHWKEIAAQCEFVWIVIIEREGDADALNEILIPFNCEFLVVRWKNEEEIQVTKVYDIKEKRIIESVMSKIYNESVVFEDLRLEQYKSDLRNTTLNVYSLCGIHNTFNVRNIVECLHLEIIYLVSARLNFSVAVTVDDRTTVDGVNPYVHPDGSDGYVFESLSDPTVDIACGSIIIITKRMSKYDFFWPTFVFKEMIYIRQEYLESTWWSYLKPLKRCVWLVFLVCILLMAAIAFFTGNPVFGKMSGSYFCAIVNSLLNILQLISNQSAVIKNESDSFRVVIATTLISTLFIFQVYSSSLLSFIAVHRPLIPYQTVEELIAEGNYKISAVNDTFMAYSLKDWLKTSKLDHLMAENFPDDDRQALEEVCNGRVAFAALKSDVVNIKRYSCEIIEIPTRLSFEFMGLALPKGSPYEDILNRELCHLHSVGITTRLKKKVLSGLRDKPETEEITVSLRNVYSIILLLVIGFTFSFFVLLFEILNKRKRLTLTL